MLGKSRLFKLCYSGPGLNRGPLNDWTTFNYLNTGLVLNSNPRFNGHLNNGHVIVSYLDPLCSYLRMVDCC